MMMVVEVPARLNDEHVLGAVATAAGEGRSGLRRHTRLDSVVAEFASRPPDLNVAVDVEVDCALREPIEAAQRRIHRASRLRRHYRSAVGSVIRYRPSDWVGT